MREALRKAGLKPCEIGHLNAHGTGTPFNDGAEAAAFARVFGSGIGSVRTTSTKAAIGHTLGAAGAIEAVFCLKALETGELPPQINTRTPVPDLTDALTRIGDRLEKDAVMSVNLGFGGSNAALVFTKP
jgi:3-oxoacyl-(acyl-carrier-protein) synthase